MRSMTSGRVIALLLVMMPFAAWADDPIGQIKTETGAVTVERGGKAQAIAIGDHVFQADTIVTAPDGTVGITFADNSMMSLGPDSRLALDQFRFDTTTEDGVFNSSLQKGTLAVKSGQIVHQTPEAMHIRTPAALLGVRGTEFVVRADGNS
ncbi:MAG TPA: FecR domain-containing protein [Aliidongia sp.]|uniref:FecR family protein n=1 Tax=Aliidongia sp. TaxID=1914230 RepID=UPI002DDD01E5|nr:FecR domain-containing protein [Aliidongia sp.]HEV2673139.1 FecR domain-containing protein [Aliidongia sp.]